MRAVLDPNVIISATLSPGGSPGLIFRHWLEGAYELVVSEVLLNELELALGYPRLRERVSTEETKELVEILRRGALTVQDPDSPPEVRSSDPDDDYLIALASISRSILVSGDSDLLRLSGQLPVLSPADFLTMIEMSEPNRT